MSVSTFFRKVFGGADVEVDEEFDDVDHTQIPAPTAAENNPATTQQGGSELPVELLDAILNLINAELPPIAARCIDSEAQRRYLADALGAPLALLAESLKQRALSELTGSRKEMQQELEKLRTERKELDSKREEQKASLLSEQRQRRALGERNRDLEAKIAELDSEIEQHKLTISSLMNKMRVAEVAEGDTAILREENEKLKASLQAKDEEIAQLTEKIAEAEAPAALEAALEQRRDATSDEEDTNAEKPRKKRGRPRKQQQAAYSPADDSTADIESVDWLLPGGAPAGHTPMVSDPDFGYQPPKHAPEPDSDAQPTLF